MSTLENLKRLKEGMIIKTIEEGLLDLQEVEQEVENEDLINFIKEEINSLKILNKEAGEIYEKKLELISSNKLDLDLFIKDKQAYLYFEQNIFNANIEVQFDDNKFNGKILLNKKDGIWEELGKENKYFNIIKEKAIKDYNAN